jgi:hypothetical protein
MCPIPKLGNAIIRRHNSMMTKHFSKRWGPKSKPFSPKIRISMFQCVTDFLVIDLVHRFPTYVHDIKTPLDELQEDVINSSPRTPAVSAHPHNSVLVLTYRAQWLMVLTIQTSMLIEGVVEIVKEVATDIEIRNHLKSKPVWDAALAYASLF